MTSAERTAPGGKQGTITFEPGGPHGEGLVVKTYGPHATAFGFRAEADGLVALQQLAPTIPRIAGWTARGVTLLERDDDRRRLVMTRAPGGPIAHLDLADRDLDAVCAISRSLLSAYWDHTGTVYGDLTLENLLVDPRSRTLTFVDPGAPRPVWHCPDVSRTYWPASRDAGYLVFSALVGMRPPERSQLVAWRLACELVADPGARQEALRCTQVHLDRLRGLPTRRWRRRLVRRVTAARLTRTVPPDWPDPSR